MFRLLAFVGAMLLMIGTASSQLAQVQIVHNSADPAAAVVDIYVNGALASDNAAFRTASPVVPLPPNTDLVVDITGPDAPDNSNPVFSKTLRLDPGERYVVIASGVLDPSQFASNSDEDAAALDFDLIVVPDIRESAATMGNVDLFAFHGATDAPKVDVLAGTTPLLEGLSFGAASKYITVPPAEYTLAVAPSGGDPIAAFTADVSGLGDAAIMVIASGFLDPSMNQDGAAFGLFAVAQAAGPFIELPATDIPVEPATVQIIHNCADPAAAEVDIYVNGNKAYDNVAFRTATPFIELPAGVDLNVVIAGPDSDDDSNPVFSKTFNLAGGERYAVIASGVLDPSNFAPNGDMDAAPLEFDLIAVDGLRPAAETMGNVELFAFHGATDAPKVDVLAGSDPLIEGLSFGSGSDYVSVPPASYTLGVAPAGGNPIAAFTADVSGLGDATIIVVASGFLDPSMNQDGAPFGLFAVAPGGGEFIELPATDVPQFAQVQIIHNAADPGAAEVDIYLGETKIADNFAFRTASEFLSVPAGEEVVIGVAGPDSESSEDALATFPVTLEATRYVVVANGVLNPDDFAANPDMRAPSIAFNLYPIANVRPRSMNPDEVDFIIFHGSTDAVSVDVTANGSVALTSDLYYGETSDYVNVPPASYTVNVAPAGGMPIANFTADLTALGNEALVIVASGFLSPMDNQNGPAFGLYAATAAGGALVELPPTTASVEESALALPTYTIAPNPASDIATITYELPVEAQVNISITDASGNQYETLNLGNQTAGSHVYTFNTNEIAQGMVFVTISAGQYRDVQKLTVVR